MKTNLVRLLRERSTERNPINMEPLPSVRDIANVLQLSSPEDAILIARTEILSLDDISLDGDIPDDVSDSE